MGNITASREQLRPDPKFGSLLASKFINCLMEDGKKSVAQNVFYKAMDIVAKKITETEPIEVFNRALENIKPAVEVRSKRVGGAAYQVPMQVNRNRQQSLAIRWLLQAVREKKGRATFEKLAEEIIAAYKREGAAVTKRDNVHRMADANKAFAHFAWLEPLHAFTSRCRFLELHYAVRMTVETTPPVGAGFLTCTMPCA